MRRPALLIVGAMLATGASLALASPASAAPSTGGDHHPNYCDNDNNYNYNWYHRRHHRHHYYGGYNHNYYHGSIRIGI
jgi:hypothetical protein